MLEGEIVVGREIWLVTRIRGEAALPMPLDCVCVRLVGTGFAEGE